MFAVEGVGDGERVRGQLLIDGNWGWESRRLDASAAKVTGRHITVRLPNRNLMFTVRGVAAGEDNVLGTKDGVELPVHRTEVDGRF